MSSQLARYRRGGMSPIIVASIVGIVFFTAGSLMCSTTCHDWAERMIVQTTTTPQQQQEPTGTPFSNLFSEEQVQERIREALLAHENRTLVAQQEMMERQVQDRVQEAMRAYNEQTAKDQVRRPPCQENRGGEKSTTAFQLPTGTGELVSGMATAPRIEFFNKFNSLGLGMPFNPDWQNNNQVIFMYRDASALPQNHSVSSDAAANETGNPPLLSVEEATENCDVVNVALLSTEKNARRCLAFVAGGGPDGYHLQRFARLPPPQTRNNGRVGAGLDPTAPLRLVGRFQNLEGRQMAPLPSNDQSKLYRSILSRYLDSLETVLERLSPIAAAAAVNNTIVVMTCNFGQSEILVNFVCGARRRNLDLSMVVVFAADEETRDIAVGLGLHTYYDDVNFGFIPKEVSPFGSLLFGTVVLAKVFCAHLASELGYDFLFQDVDVVWYRNPLDYFAAWPDRDNSTKFDLYVQDDGSRVPCYGAKSSNAGFFFARNNEMTRAFFHAYLMAGDHILSHRNDQIVFNSLLNEHSSANGIRIYTMSSLDDEFPAGYAFRVRRDYMKDIIAGKVKPYIFHMSWTTNKAMKVQFLQQMGDWSVREACVQKRADEILHLTWSDGTEVNATMKVDMTSIHACCLPEPAVTCHYRDMPSIIPCNHSSPLREWGGSFWE